MRHTLPPHIWIATFAEHIIVLDLRADRYSRLGKVAADVLLTLARDDRLSVEQTEAARKLAAAGILAGDGSGRRVAGLLLALPTASALEQVTPDLDRRPSVVRCGLAVLGAQARLRVTGFERTIEVVRTWKAGARSVVSEGRAVALARGYARARNAIPIARACLPDSLALFGLLVAAGIDATLVIGVRDQPFAAHCWVQTDAFILTDALAPIRELTPILSI
ncbi:hypothetical protein ACVWZA_004016 [Sphingomonas sp. UYAg733]